MLKSEDRGSLHLVVGVGALEEEELVAASVLRDVEPECPSA